MKKHWQYLCYVLRHKWFVFMECCTLGIPWLGIVHDLSKFLPSEFFPYADHFYGRRIGRQRDSTGYYKPVDTGDPQFDLAWHLHAKRNRHHWQWWIQINDEDPTMVMEMPGRYRKEMLADWIGAGKAQGKSDARAWYEKNKSKMILGVATRAWIERQLCA